jgi:hypothetical protein
VSVIRRMGTSLVEPSNLARLGRRKAFVYMTGGESFRYCNVGFDGSEAVLSSLDLASSCEGTATADGLLSQKTRSDDFIASSEADNDISPTHSTAITGPFASISWTSKPSKSNTNTFPACVPTAINEDTTDKHVAGAETCYVRSTCAPSAKSTSRHRPSSPILTTRDLYPGINAAAVMPPIAALCSF